VGEIADILEDLHEQRDEQGEQRRRVPGACGSRVVVLTVLYVGPCAPGVHGALCPWPVWPRPRRGPVEGVPL
jgi:hypothetical protein